MILTLVTARAFRNYLNPYNISVL